MKKLVTTLMVMTMSLAAYCGNVVKIIDLDKYDYNVPITFTENELATVDSLVLKGEYMDEIKFQCIREFISKGVLTGIDMSDVGLNFTNSLPEYAFCNKGSDERMNLHYITLPRVASRIGAHAFERCNLRGIKIPSAITDIDSGAFSGCDELTWIDVANRYLSIDGQIRDDAFSGVPKDIAVKVPVGTLSSYRENTVWAQFGKMAEDEDVYMAKDVAVSGQPISSLLGDDAMKIDSLHVSGTITADDFHFIRKCVCYGNLSSVDLGDCVIEGGEFPKWGFEFKDGDKRLFPFRLRQFRFPKNVETIIGDMFKFATLVNFTIPGTIKTIETYAFKDCRFVCPVRISEGVTKIKDYAFHDSNDAILLEHNRTMYLPSSIKTVGSSSLAITLNKGNFTLYCNRMTPPDYNWSEKKGPFIAENNDDYPNEIYGQYTLYVPIGAKNAYLADEYWKWFENIIETPELDGGQSSGIKAAVTESDGSGKPTAIYSLDGTYLGTSESRLPHGIYIVGGKKVVR